MTDLYKFNYQPRLTEPTLIVSWGEDAGRLGPAVVDYLIEKFDATCFCEIEPAPFFSLTGVSVYHDIAHFPEIKFYAGNRNDLIILKAAQPQYDRYFFLNTLLDVAQHHYQAKLALTLSGTIAPLAHTQPRRIMAVYNHPEIQQDFRTPELEDMSWSGPPAMSSYLLWVAQKRDLLAVSLWAEIPFYLAPHPDYKTIFQILTFLRRKFTLDLDLHPIEQKASQQSEKIEIFRHENMEIEQLITSLESQLTLTSEEQMGLSRKISRLLQE
ncbi:MAG: hypothetical protein GY869_11295 [Planctomycetes bacterium]|nr:hypothetical protein [Planctomycetota bacterium]